MAAIEILAGILLIILLGLIVFAAIMYNKRGKDLVPPNSSIVLNMNPSLTDGYFTLLEVSAKEMSNGRYRCQVVPLGRYYDYIEGKFSEDLKIYDIIVEKNFRTEAVKGSPHKSRAIIMYEPRDSKNLHPMLAESELGKMAAKASDYNALKNMFLEYVDVVKTQVGELLLLTPKLPEKVILAKINDLFVKVVENLKDKGGASNAPGFTPRF